MMTFGISTPARLLGVALLLAACRSEPAGVTEDPVLARYVAFGNSVTAGFQSNGINDSTQKQSYAWLLAAQMGVPFDAPLLAKPGCPPPLTNVFTGATLSPSLCSFAIPATSSRLNNVAIPGAAIVDIYSNNAPGSGANPLTSIMLVGKTQLQAARTAQPTFATVWIGHNEILGAARDGDATRATTPSLFASRYATAMDSIATLNLRGALLIGVLDATKIPYLSTGAAYLQAKQAGGLPASFNVNANCAAGSALVPFAYGFGLIGRAQAGETVSLDCVNDADVLTSAEVTTLRGYIVAYNASIAERASARQWMYFDPNPIFDSVRAAGDVPDFPHAPPDPRAQAEPFGKWLSLDGIHPSALAHRLVANRIIDLINARYGSNIPRLP
jgi:lysophospholipase L1-like esterase